MEPIPETVEALRALTRRGDDTVARMLMKLSEDVVSVVPDIVGVSLTLLGEGMTFTLTASSSLAAELDAVQYLDGGPCDQTAKTGQRSEYHVGNAVDEKRWHLFARATAAAGVASTLSLPVSWDDDVIASVNLYAATADAFDGRHDELARVCGSTAEAAISNADLGFTTRFAAAETSERLQSGEQIERAVSTLVSYLHLTSAEARQVIGETALRAGISDVQLARVVVESMLG